MKIDDQTRKEILAHARQSEPQESCGFVISIADGLYYFPCNNVADDPVNYFEISPDEFIQAEGLGRIVALVHSHPDSEHALGLPYLSTADRECQLRTGLDFWLVVSGEIRCFRAIPPLLGRKFENNKQDCRNILLDCYALSGIELPDHSTYEFNWFESANLYEEGLIRCGFEKLPFDETPQLGDVVLIKVGADVANHAGVYLGEQMMIHHSESRLSARVPYDGFWLNATHSIWRHSQWQKLHFTAILNDLQINRSSLK
ncbi:phage tail protein [Pasteurellaceae bacterium Macca]|nr:phage tail protein [Pasteurellaceae bacterium Macca]MCK3656744.1 phage tail protein [Pasteurellaceae bacterium Macca]MCK3657082.1 phage tail protein [Pasteurellaceae bacterium Macca]